MKGALLFIFLIIPFFGQSIIINHINTNEKIVAFTFDACETKTPATFDKGILNFILSKKLPVTIFVNGKFAIRNRDSIKELSSHPFISIQNHSFHHYLHMEKMKEKDIKDDLRMASEIIFNLTGKKDRFFRFPGGNYDNNSLTVVEKEGYKVVHWSFESGDPDKNMTKEKLISRVKGKVKPGSILIFHINGRGLHTAKALPEIINFLDEKGYRFVLLEDIL
ncbi:MAG: polysaccharide deacetylase family protein [Calditerrivibrio sp.]|nr:polysaccharide deacetylase family protein [Calditerrivibrio sp.]